MSRSNSCMVCTYLIELVAGIMTGYIFIYLDDAIEKITMSSVSIKEWENEDLGESETM